MNLPKTRKQERGRSKDGASPRGDLGLKKRGKPSYPEQGTLKREKKPIVLNPDIEELKKKFTK